MRSPSAYPMISGTSMRTRRARTWSTNGSAMCVPPGAARPAHPVRPFVDDRVEAGREDRAVPAHLAVKAGHPGQIERSETAVPDGDRDRVRGPERVPGYARVPGEVVSGPGRDHT